MSLEELLRDRRIQKIRVSRQLSKKALLLALRDIKASEDNLRVGNFDWAYSIAYNAMLQAGRGLMFSKGYRPHPRAGHIAVIDFLRVACRKEIDEQLLYALDKMRRRRHMAVYEEPMLVSKRDARHALGWAKNFVASTKRLI